MDRIIYTTSVRVKQGGLFTPDKYEEKKHYLKVDEDGYVVAEEININNKEI